MFSRMLRWKPATPNDSAWFPAARLKVHAIPSSRIAPSDLDFTTSFSFLAGSWAWCPLQSPPQNPIRRGSFHPADPRPRVFARWERLAHREAEDGGRDFPSLD